MKAEEIYVLTGYCPYCHESMPCSECSYFDGKQCTHDIISVSIVAKDEAGKEITIKFPIEAADVTIQKAN